VVVPLLVSVEVPVYRVIFALGSAVPETTGVAVVTGEPFDGEPITGLTGAVVSIVRLRPEDAVVLPAASVAFAVCICVPSASELAVILHTPEPSAFAVPNTVVPLLSYRLTLAFASALPAMLGVAVLTEPEGVVNAGFAGATVSTIRFKPVEKAAYHHKIQLQFLNSFLAVFCPLVVPVNNVTAIPFILIGGNGAVTVSVDANFFTAVWRFKIQFSSLLILVKSFATLLMLESVFFTVKYGYIW